VCTGALETAEEGVLSCRLCGQQRPVLCASCGSIRLKALRSGTTRVREELEALVGATVAEVTGQEQSSESTAVMVGTEALLHRVAHGNVVVFLDFDAELLAARFAAGEQALGLLARAARVVTGDGPGAPRGPGRLVIQTRQPSHPVLLSAVGADPGRLAAEEAELRRILALPPESAMAKISGVVAEQYVEDLRAAAPPGVEIGGSAEHGWSVKAPDHRVLCDLLATVRRPPGRLRVEVDPVRG
jgi:primosomal protein N' (replication factor Y)